MPNQKSSLKEWFYNKLYITRNPVIRVYNGYGDNDQLIIYGHVLKQSPLPRRKFRKNFWSNSLSLLRLFMVQPFKNARVVLEWQDMKLEAITDVDGFFKFEWKPEKELEEGWHRVTVRIAEGKFAGHSGEGKLLVPHNTRYLFISDIDDTFLVSHSSNLRKRLYVLLTKNARTRRPFEGVVRHYQLLAHAGTSLEAPNAFFYVSSSEWNLYDYIREFKRSYGIPEGVYLLNQLKQGYEFLKTGQTKHNGKFFRIIRILKEFPNHRYILLGDDTQMDPEIYQSVAENFPDRIHCVYLRHVGKHKRPEVEERVRAMKALGVEVCYFTTSSEAIAHSKKMGLIES